MKMILRVAICMFLFTARKQRKVAGRRKRGDDIGDINGNGDGMVPQGANEYSDIYSDMIFTYQLWQGYLVRYVWLAYLERARQYGGMVRHENSPEADGAVVPAWRAGSFSMDPTWMENFE